MAPARPRAPRAILALLGAATLLLSAGGARAHTSVEPTTRPLPDVVADAVPAVVAIHNQSRFGLVRGSGVVVDPSGLILTSYHVIAGARTVRVVIRPGAARRGPAVLRLRGRVIDASRGRDLALVRVAARGLPALSPRTSPAPRLGETALSIGFALSLPGGPSVSHGIVSGLNRSLPVDGRRLHHLLQTDAAVNRGSSGGPLLDRDGRLIGINAALIADGYTQNVAFAVDIRQALPLIRKALATRPSATPAATGAAASALSG